MWLSLHINLSHQYTSITSMWLSLPLWHQWQRAILLLGLLPLLELSLGLIPLSGCLSIISPLLNKGYQSYVMLKIHHSCSPIWPSHPLKLCLSAFSSNIGLFSRYASDKYLLLESWEEECLPLRVCLPLYSLEDEQYATTAISFCCKCYCSTRT